MSRLFQMYSVRLHGVQRHCFKGLSLRLESEMAAGGVLRVCRDGDVDIAPARCARSGRVKTKRGPGGI